MAKALFHKSQRVFVKPVGTWATVEHVVPHWVKDVNEPLRVTYDCGLGRPFHAHELVSEQAVHNQNRVSDDDDDTMLEHWTVERRTIKWRPSEFGVTLSNPGTYPVVTTDEGSSGGWRVGGSEYDRDPQRIEHQARMIVHTPDLLRIARRITEYATDHPSEFPADLKPVAQHCALILRNVYRLDEELTVAAE
ncbi:MAG: hypothetical protein MUE84_06105 [Hyphomonas sp.]|jgi:hypothetical protein|nr:hypothetical protein [Hyphomonas sp.]